MHATRITILSESFPTQELYPFKLEVMSQTRHLDLTTPVTFFVGENGSGKSTLLEAVARRSGIHIWWPEQRSRVVYNPVEQDLYQYIKVDWVDGPAAGSFFAAEIFKNFAQNLDEWASTDPGQLKYFGGQSLLTQSHGQSLMSFFRSRYRIEGLYLLDEPETALSPRTQLDLLRLLYDMGRAGHAQFIVATHSPILLSCPGALIYDFNQVPVRRVEYEATEHYQVYKDFMENPARFFQDPLD
ncbi:MAG: AAA family ATPase [Proteobacteria bacterium]|nr:AAA family ATPase [Pseudomonadota bacterium]